MVLIVIEHPLDAELIDQHPEVTAPEGFIKGYEYGTTGSYSIGWKLFGKKTSFQIAALWKAEYDVRLDIAVVYGVDDSFEERVKGYRERGYRIKARRR